jgi:hypothetical protein
MRYVKLLFVFVFTLIIVASFSLAKPEYSKKEAKDGKNLACTYCHVKTGSKDLNDVGKCYAKNDHSLAKCGEKTK